MNHKIAIRILTEFHPEARHQQNIYLTIIRCLRPFPGKYSFHLAGRESIDAIHTLPGPVIASTGHIDEGFVSSDDSAVVGSDFSTCRSTGKDMVLRWRDRHKQNSLYVNRKRWIKQPAPSGAGQ